MDIEPTHDLDAAEIRRQVSAAVTELATEPRGNALEKVSAVPLRRGWVPLILLAFAVAVEIAIILGGDYIEGRTGSAAAPADDAAIAELVSAASHYRDDRGAPPALLSDLVPTYVQSLPRLRPKQSLRYEAMGQGFAIEVHEAE